MTSYNLFNMLQAAADVKPDSPFFYEGGIAISYANALNIAGRLSHALQSRGIGHGDRVIIQLGNSREFIFCLLALAHSGAVAVLVNPAAGRYEMRSYIEIAGPSAVITTSDKILDLRDGDSFMVRQSSIFTTDHAAGFVSISDMIRDVPNGEDAAAIEADHPFAIIFTSAMEGVPLGALLTHRGIYETARASDSIFVKQDDTFITALPLFHSFGLSSSLFTPLYNMAPFHLLKRFSPRAVIAAINFGATVMAGVPAMFNILAAAFPAELRLPGVRIWISGGETLSRQTQEMMLEKFGIDIREGYGLTEASPVVTWNGLDRQNRHGSIGTPLPYNRVKIVKDNKVCGPETEGEILVKGVNVVPGYYNRPDATERHIQDGWLRTGDLGLFDKDGYYYITGRIKNMVIRKGFNIYPAEVEKLLRYHPSIESVRVTGHFDRNSDNSFKEWIEAKIRPRAGQTLTPEEMHTWCRENISRYKVPDKFSIIF